MIGQLIGQAGLVVAMALACWALPAWGLKKLLPVLSGPDLSVRNYRGRTITTGLGVVWLLWAAGLFLAAGGAPGVVGLTAAAAHGSSPFGGVSISRLWPSGALPMVALVLAAFAFGLIDDLLGDGTAKGFRGHLGALRRGRLTTGALKLVGIGAASAFAASRVLSGTMSWRPELHSGWGGAAAWWVDWALATIVIALSANLVNLMDLRPGRALKVYGAGSLAAIAGLQFLSTHAIYSSQVVLGFSGTRWIETTGGAIGLVLLALGPLLAVWPHDLGERGMLGDAGANAAGALAGYLAVAALPGWWYLALAAALLLALNLASEQVSFSEVIERNGLLSWLDSLGRVREKGRAIAEAAGEAEIRDRS